MRLKLLFYIGTFAMRAGDYGDILPAEGHPV
jgi:hypothetical protein